MHLISIENTIGWNFHQKIKFEKDVFIWGEFNEHVLYLNHLQEIKRKLLIPGLQIWRESENQ